jgi:hypothetical protein
MSFKYLVLAFLFQMSGSLALAGGIPSAVQSAVHATRLTVDDLKNIQVQGRADVVLNTVIDRSAQALRAEGHWKEANQLMNEWNEQKQSLFLGMELIGDHAPLSKWLAEKYQFIAQILGEKRVKKYHLDDIYTVNYAVPVVLKPSQDWGVEDYGQHFDPLAGVLTFWSSYEYCLHVAGKTKRAKRYCDRIGTILRYVMVTRLSPGLSKYVYQKFHGNANQGDFVITDDQLMKQYGAELNAVQY